MTQDEMIRYTLERDWHNYREARRQAWGVLAAVSLVTGGLLAANWNVSSVPLRVTMDVILFFVTLVGVQMTLHQRNRVELPMLKHIITCEQQLGLDEDDRIDSRRSLEPIDFWQAFVPARSGLSLFLLRMHAGLFLLATGLLGHDLLYLGQDLAALGYLIFGLGLLTLLLASLTDQSNGRKAEVGPQENGEEKTETA